MGLPFPLDPAATVPQFVKVVISLRPQYGSTTSLYMTPVDFLSI